MAKLPTVALIGRPNTGKSTLFNKLVGSRRAIVSETPGTTRDPIVQRVNGEHLDYLLMDTGGMGGGTSDTDFEDDVHSQSLIALEHGDVILFVVDGREELTAADHEIVSELRQKRRKHVPVFLILSKCDDPQKIDEALPKTYELNIADTTFAVSAFHGTGMDELENSIESALKEMHFSERDHDTKEDTPRIALVGRPNVGKSSIINALMPEKQRETQGRIVSDVPGTTRDTTDATIRSKGKEYLFLDTAGLKKSKRKESEIEAYAAMRTLTAIENADVTVLVLDASQPFGRQDKRIASIAIERGTGLILLVNKCDLLEPLEKEMSLKAMQRAFPFCRYAPILLTSAISRDNLPKLFELITTTQENRNRRVETSVLNNWFRTIVGKYQPKGLAGASRAKYITQVEVRPPSFAVFTNDTKRMHFSTIRFLENKLRETFSFEGTPIRWIRKDREE